jgi:hypothetical protein
MENTDEENIPNRLQSKQLLRLILNAPDCISQGLISVAKGSRKHPAAQDQMGEKNVYTSGRAKPLSSPLI